MWEQKVSRYGETILERSLQQEARQNDGFGMGFFPFWPTLEPLGGAPLLGIGPIFWPIFWRAISCEVIRGRVFSRRALVFSSQQPQLPTL